MNIAIGNIISSLDKIVKNRNTMEKKDKSLLSESKSTAPEAEPTGFSSSIIIKYQILQSKLSKLQNELSREQARLGVLEKENIQPKEISNLLFGNTPLFSESIDDVIQEKHQLVEKISARKSFIADQIKSVEIESENFHSIRIGNSSNDYQKKLEAIRASQKPMTKISQASVERLIKD